MKLAVAEMADMSSEEEKTARKMSVLSDQAEAYKKKISLLTDSYDKQKSNLAELKKNLDEATQSTGENSSTTLKAKAAYDKQVKVVYDLDAQLKRTEASLKTTEHEMDRLGNETEETSQQLEQGSKGVESFAQSVAKFVSGQAVWEGIKKTASALKELALGAASLSDDLATQATVTGLSTDALQEYNYMAELVDVSVDTITGSMTKLTSNMSKASKGSGDAYDAFKKLNVSFKNVDGTLRSNQDVFNDLVDALGDIDNETERDAISMTLFGRSAKDLNPLIKAGSKQIKAYAQEAHDMGYVMSKDVISKNVEASDAMERLKNAASGAKNAIGSALAPVLKSTADTTTRLVQWTREHSDTLVSLAKVLGIATTAILTYKGAMLAMDIISKVRAATEGMTVAQAALNAVMSANPVALLVTALGVLVAAMVLFNKEAAPEMSENFKQVKSDMDELDAAMAAQVESWGHVSSAMDRAIESGLSEISYTKELYDELQTIVDANGEIKEGYEDRATFITEQLAKALGVEIELKDGVIQGYKEIQAEIDKTIEKKKAEIIINAQEAAYTQAIRDRETAVLNRVRAEEKLSQALKNQGAVDKEIKQLQMEWEKELSNTYDGEINYRLIELGKEIEAKRQESKAYGEIIDTEQANLEEYSNTVNDIYYTIAQYEKNMEYLHKEEFDKISSVNADTARSYESMSDAEKQAIEAIYGSLAGESSKMYAESKKTFANLVAGATAGINDPTAQASAFNAMAGFSNRLLNTARNTLAIQSPSKKMKQIGEYLLQGLGIGIESEERGVLQEITAFGKSTISAFNKATQGGFDVQAQPQNAEFTNVGGNTALKIGGSTYVIKLQLDGRDIAQNTTKYQNQWQRAYST